MNDRKGFIWYDIEFLIIVIMSLLSLKVSEISPKKLDQN